QPKPKPPAEIQALIEACIKGFTTGDNKLYFSVFSDTAIITDGIPPFRWLNPDAPAKWMADVEIWRKKFGVIKEEFVYEWGFSNVQGDFAYAVVSGTLTVTTNGPTLQTTGLLAFTFAKRDGVWKMEAQTWARTS